MPTHQIHMTMEQLIFGIGMKFPEIHKYMDQWQPTLQSKHRIFGHDSETVEMFKEIHPIYGQAAYLHILLDAVSDVVGQDSAVPVLLSMIMDGSINL